MKFLSFLCSKLSIKILKIYDICDNILYFSDCDLLHKIFPPLCQTHHLVLVQLFNWELTSNLGAKMENHELN